VSKPSMAPLICGWPCHRRRGRRAWDRQRLLRRLYSASTPAVALTPGQWLRPAGEGWVRLARWSNSKKALPAVPVEIGRLAANALAVMP